MTKCIKSAISILLVCSLFCVFAFGPLQQKADALIGIDDVLYGVLLFAGACGITFAAYDIAKNWAVGIQRVYPEVEEFVTNVGTSIGGWLQKAYINTADFTFEMKQDFIDIYKNITQDYFNDVPKVSTPQTVEVDLYNDFFIVSDGIQSDGHMLGAWPEAFSVPQTLPTVASLEGVDLTVPIDFVSVNSTLSLFDFISTPYNTINFKLLYKIELSDGYALNLSTISSYVVGRSYGTGYAYSNQYISKPYLFVNSKGNTSLNMFNFYHIQRNSDGVHIKTTYNNQMNIYLCGRAPNRIYLTGPGISVSNLFAESTNLVYDSDVGTYYANSSNGKVYLPYSCNQNYLGEAIASIFTGQVTKVPVIVYPDYLPGAETQNPVDVLENGGDVIIKNPGKIEDLIGTNPQTIVTFPPYVPPPPDPSFNDFRAPNLIFQKFPFSIPWDLVAAVSILQAPPKDPVWEIPFHIESINFTYDFELDLTKYESFIRVFRWFLSGLFIVGLIAGTKKLMKV